MPIVAPCEPEGEEEMTQRQVGYITHLLEARRVSARCASHLIEILEQEPAMNGSGLENLKQRMNLENT